MDVVALRVVEPELLSGRARDRRRGTAATPAAAAIAASAIAVLIMDVTAAPEIGRRIAGTPLGTQAVNKKLTMPVPMGSGIAGCARLDPL